MTEHRTLAGAVGDVLARLGIAPAARLDAVVSTATAILAERGHDAVVLGVRHRELRIGANGYAARLLRADLDPVHAAIEAAVPGSVERIIVMRRQ